MIRVLIADDHAIVRDGLAQLINGAGGMTVVAVAANGQEAVSLAAEHQPDVVLVDLSMPVMDGVKATRALTTDHPDLQVVVLTTFSDQRRILDALDAGAAGYLLKDSEPDDIIGAIRTVMEGEAPLHPKAARVLLDAQRTAAPGRQLTVREREVLELVGAGLANKAIARRLEITERTVKAHLTSVFQHLGVTDRTQAALWVRDHPLPS